MTDIVNDLAATARAWLGAGFGVAGGALADWGGPLFRSEACAVTRAVKARRAEFAAGRMALRAALLDLDHPPVALPRSPSGAPAWPVGVTGSLSHGGGAVLAVVTQEPGVALGVDLEPWAGLDAETAEAIGAPPGLDGLRVFCAREAAYKAQHPVLGRMLDHADVAVTLAGDRFVARLRGAAPATLAGWQAVVPGPQGALLLTLLAWRHTLAALDPDDDRRGAPLAACA